MIRRVERSRLTRIGLAAFVLAGSLALSACSTDKTVCYAGGDAQDNPASAGVEVTRHVSFANEDYDLEDYWANSDLVCVGTYVDASEPLLIEPVDGSDPLYFTDLHFSVSDVLSGSVPESCVEDDGTTTLTVRQQGGVGERVALVNDDALVPSVGDSYLLFLYEIDDGSDYNTEGDHFYLIGGGEFGAWKETGEGTFSKFDGSETVTSEELDELASAPQVTRTSTQQDGDSYLQEIEVMYLNGEIPKEYYDEVMGRETKEAAEFARVLGADEVEAYEERIVGSSS